MIVPRMRSHCSRTFFQTGTSMPGKEKKPRSRRRRTALRLSIIKPIRVPIFTSKVRVCRSRRLTRNSFLLIQRGNQSTTSIQRLPIYGVCSLSPRPKQMSKTYLAQLSPASRGCALKMMSERSRNRYRGRNSFAESPRLCLRADLRVRSLPV